MSDLLLFGAAGVLASAVLLSMQGRHPFESRAFTVLLLACMGIVAVFGGPRAYAFFLSLTQPFRIGLGLVAGVVLLSLSPELRRR